MANNSLDITTAYIGEGAAGYIAPAILSADTLANNYVKIHSGVKKALYLSKVDSGAIQAATCDFTSVDDDITMTEAILTPTELMRNIQLCKKDFRGTWEALQTGAGFINDRVPPTFQAFLLNHLAEKVQAGIEKAIWRGEYNETDGSTTGGTAVSTFNGLLAKVVAGTPGYENLVAGAFTADNNATTGILTHLEDLVSNLPDAIDGDPDTKIYMSRKSLALYQLAMSDVSLGGAVSTRAEGDRPASYLGYEIIVPAGFPNDTICAWQTENLHFGTDLTSDYNKAVVVDMTKTDASDNVRVAMRFVGGTQIGFLGDVAVARRSS